MTPLLVAFLVLQGGLAVLPHHHVHAATNHGPELTVESTDSALHDCLACSIHAPAMEDSEGASTDTGCTDVPAAAEYGTPVLGAACLDSASPRGPPVIV